MADDYSLAAHPYVPPATNPLEMLQGIERYRILQNQNKTTGLEAQQKQIDTDALKNYGDNGDSRVLKGATPELRTGAEAGERGYQVNKTDVMSRDASYILNEQNPKIKQYLWDAKKDEYIKRGWLDKQTADKYPTPHDGILENFARGNMSIPQYGETSGATAGRQEAAKAPYITHSGPATDVIQTPAVRPGGPLENGQPKPSVLRPAVPANVSATPPGGAAGAPTGAPTPQPGQAPVGSPASKPGKNVTAVDKTAQANPYDDEVPVNPVGHDMPTGKGIIQPGIDPVRQAARAEGVKQFNDDIQPKGAAASRNLASLGTMKAELDSGKTDTHALAGLQERAAGILYAFSHDPAFVQKATGIDLGSQENLQKGTVRQGLGYSKDTIGGREAYNSIVVSLKANPSMLTSLPGNRQIIAGMMAGEKYDLERAKAAEAYMRKNDGHLVGFDNWFNKDHSPATFISKAIPYPTVVEGKYIAKDDLQPGVTYTYGGDTGDKFKGTWDGEHFTKVKQ